MMIVGCEFHMHYLNRGVRQEHAQRIRRRTYARQSFMTVACEVRQDSEIAHPGAASTRRHYQSHPGTRFP